jgi:hypothetical protein
MGLRTGVDLDALIGVRKILERSLQGVALQGAVAKAKLPKGFHSKPAAAAPRLRVIPALRAERLLSLDAFRGISIAAMILVNIDADHGVLHPGPATELAHVVESFLRRSNGVAVGESGS